jgi:Sigma-54 interaction domain
MAGESKAWKDVLTQAAKVASTDTTVLLLGESGTGKEVVARLLARERPDHARPPAFDRGARHDRARFATVPVQQVEGGKDAAHAQAALRSASAATGSRSGARHRKVPKWLTEPQAGRVMVTVVPTLFSLRTPIVPPFSSTFRLAMVRPRPVPAALVEKYGSKILDIAS